MGISLCEGAERSPQGGAQLIPELLLASGPQDTFLGPRLCQEPLHPSGLERVGPVHACTRLHSCTHPTAHG